MVAFGDSLTYGIGSERGGGYVSMLSQELGVPIENLGVPGDTSADGLRRLSEVIAKKPTVAIVLFGGNDLLQKVPATETAKNLALINATLKNTGTKVILLDLEILKGVWGHSELMSDSLHPNDKGYTIIAAKIAPSLKALVRPPFWLLRGR